MTILIKCQLCSYQLAVQPQSRKLIPLDPNFLIFYKDDFIFIRRVHCCFIKLQGLNVMTVLHPVKYHINILFLNSHELSFNNFTLTKFFFPQFLLLNSYCLYFNNQILSAIYYILTSTNL